MGVLISIQVMVICTFSVFTIDGRLIQVLENSEKKPGMHKKVLFISDLSSGIYLYVLEVDGISVAKKMIYLK